MLFTVDENFIISFVDATVITQIITQLFKYGNRDKLHDMLIDTELGGIHYVRT